MSTWIKAARYKRYVIRSDGAVCIDGEKQEGNIDLPVSIEGGKVILKEGIYDELLIVPTEITDEGIAHWSKSDGVFVDPDEVYYQSAEISRIDQKADNISLTVANLDTSVGNQLSQINMDIDSISSVVYDETAGLSAAWSEINQTPTKISQAVASLRSDVDDDIADVYTQIDQTATSITAMVNALDTNLTGQISAVDQKADNINLAVTSLDASVTTRFASINLRADGIETLVSDTEAGLTTLVNTTASGINAMISNLDEDLTGQISDIDVRVDGIDFYLADVEDGLPKQFANMNLRIDGIQSTVGDTETGLVSQVTQLASEYTIKLNSNGHVAGVGLALDPISGESEFAVAADKFSVATPTGAKNVFTVIDGKAYLVGDMIAEGSILAEQLEADVMKTLLFQAKLAIIDDADILQLDAQRIFVGDNIELGDNRIAVKGKHSATQRVDITEDTYVDSFDPNTNNSTEKYLYADGTRTTLMKVSLPDGVITSVKLVIVGRDVEYMETTVRVHPITSSWDPATVTWNTRPIIGAPATSLSGLFYDDSLEFDITDIVTSGSNYGVAIDSDGGSLFSIYSSRSSVAGDQWRPYIEVTGQFDSSPLETKTAIGDLGGLPWQGGVIPQGTHGLYTVDGYFRGDISGSSGEFADGKIKIGYIGGKPWGLKDNPLPPGTTGIWGEQSGIFMRGYVNLIAFGTCEDEEPIVIPEGIAVNPRVMIALKHFLAYRPGDTFNNQDKVHVFSDAIMVNDTEWTAKIKVVREGDEVPWTGRSVGTGTWSLTQPNVLIEGKRGVFTDYIICRPKYQIGTIPLAGGSVTLTMEITNQFDTNGNPINWRTVETFTSKTNGVSGTLNWDKAVPMGQWAARISGKTTNIIGTWKAQTGIIKWGYRVGTQYLDVEGDVIKDVPDPAIHPSGMSAMYFVFDQG